MSPEDAVKVTLKKLRGSFALCFIFRGFENIGTDYGMIMAILGGDDAGGGVIWAPQVLEDAKNHGLVLSD